MLGARQCAKCMTASRQNIDACRSDGVSNAGGSSSISRGSRLEGPCRWLELVLGSISHFLLLGLWCGCRSSCSLVGLWEEVLQIDIGFSKISPRQSLLNRIDRALLDCDVLVLLGLSRRGAPCFLRTSGSPFSLILLRGILPIPSVLAPWQFVQRLADFYAFLPEGSSCKLIASIIDLD